MSNVLSEEKRQQVLALGRLGWPLRRIEETTGVRRETASKYLKAAGIGVRPPGRWGHPPKAAKDGFSRKAVRLLVWKSSTKIWSQLHEKAFHRLGGVPKTVVLDNLREGVIKADVFDPTLNPLYADMLLHYGVVALPCRVRHPNRVTNSTKKPVLPPLLISGLLLLPVTRKPSVSPADESNRSSRSTSRWVLACLSAGSPVWVGA